TVDYVDGDSLALGQARDPGAVQRRSVNKDILAAPICADEAKPLHGIVPLNCAGLLDGGPVGRGIHSSLRSCASGRLLLRGAAIDAQDFIYLRPLGPRSGADLEHRARRYATVAAALDHTHMQEGIA